MCRCLESFARLRGVLASSPRLGHGLLGIRKQTGGTERWVSRNDPAASPALRAQQRVCQVDIHVSDGFPSTTNPKLPLLLVQPNSQDPPLTMVDDLTSTDGMMATGTPTTGESAVELKPEDNPNPAKKLGLHIHVDNDSPDFE
jgi:hypothetical protein